MNEFGRSRVIIENVKPSVDGGTFPVKRVVGETVVVEADVFADGHDRLSAILLYRSRDEAKWRQIRMQPVINDRWRAEFTVTDRAGYLFTVQGWIDHFLTWQSDLSKKFEADQDISVDLLVGADLIEDAATRAPDADAKKLRQIAESLRGKMSQSESVTYALSDELSELMDAYPDLESATLYDKELPVSVDRPKALFSTWYEMFPRSAASDPKQHGTFRDCIRQLPRIAKMGFDVLYLPPIHPIGKVNRKGKNNSPSCEPSDPGSPWAIGSDEGGHKAIHPQLGSMDDFEELLRAADSHGLEVAMDLAFQCAPDHPYVKEHPEWFRTRPDGTIQFAENPPKKYEDIVPFNFETDNWKELWEELRSIVIFWIEKGVKIFRVDNPHTKSLAFWEWLMADIREKYPDVLFLAEAFTRPRTMYRLGKVGFHQSYTYFTWRNTKREITSYLTDLTGTDISDFYRPNFWPNTPDILPQSLQYGGRPAFIMKLVLAATLSSNYGIYGPAFELLVTEAIAGKEEYLDSEKYEIKDWDFNLPGELSELIARVNQIRRENPALQSTRNLTFYDVDNEYLLLYGKTTDDGSNQILTLVNLDPYHRQSGWITVPLADLGIDHDRPYLAHDLIGGDHYIWQGERNYVELDPNELPAHILRIHRRMRREMDFDYFM